MEDISTALAPLVSVTIDGPTRMAKRGRRFENAIAPLSKQACNDRMRAGKRSDRKRCIAVLDMETDPFDDTTKSPIFPFVCELYSDQFGSIVIWEDNLELFVTKVYAAIESLPDAYTIYAHNGGKFDFLFLVSKLRGDIKFKGRAIMVAKIGNHELRDSLHILPEKLAAWKKDTFDYNLLRKDKRHKNREKILAYLHSDCVYLFDIVKSFIQEFGLKLSIGQAAFSELKKSYKVEHISEQSDDFLRRYFFGGRVECLAGRGLFDTDWRGHNYKLFDVNSMYPSVMANHAHPIGRDYGWRRGDISEQTVFVDIRCKANGAFVFRNDDQFNAEVGTGYQRYFTTIWEYNVATKYGLLDDAEIIGVVDFRERTDFRKTVLPLYERKEKVSEAMALLKALGKETSTEFEEYHKQRLFLKYLLNNIFGKFAQNPRNFKEYYYTDVGCAPPKEWMEFLEEMNDDLRHKFSFPMERTDDFLVWAKPSPGRRYNNVATAASITGAARAVLLEAIQNSVDPIYCDTDSLICKSLSDVEIHKSKLGAWDLEAEFDRVIIAGKKTYACEVRGYADDHEKRIKVRAKGGSGLKWADFERMLNDETIENVNKAPTITKAGHQHYLLRRIKATAPKRTSLVIPQRRLVTP
jgi:hypothetical protein